MELIGSKLDYRHTRFRNRRRLDFLWTAMPTRSSVDLMSRRLSYEESCRVLQKQIEGATIAEVHAGQPRYDDEAKGVRVLNVMVAGGRLENLTLPRIFFGRSEIRDTSFRNSDLSQSTANWNDFIDVNFNSADLSGSDFRACVFQNVRFARATLVGVDFRYCGFKKCDFSDADLTDAKFTIKTGKSLHLSPEQESVVDWQADDGDEPSG